MNAIEVLSRLSLEGLMEKYQSENKETATKRLVYELNIVDEWKKADFFLAAMEIANWIRSKGIVISNGHGALPGSIIAYCIGLTAVDPIKYDLVFERFTNLDSDNAWFIWLLVPMQKLPEIKNYLFSNYPEFLDLIAIEGSAELDVLQNVNEKLDLDDIDFADESVWGDLSVDDICNLIEADLDNPPAFLKDIQIDGIETLADVLSLYRPGPDEHIPAYIKGKQAPQKIEYICEQLRPILEHTGGVVIYQEQVMRIMHDLAGFSWEQSNELRKNLAKKKILPAWRKNFIYGNEELKIAGCLANGFSEEEAEQVWNLLTEMAYLGFNKSHAIGYAMDFYSQLWVRHYYSDRQRMS